MKNDHKNLVYVLTKLGFSIYRIDILKDRVYSMESEFLYGPGGRDIRWSEYFSEFTENLPDVVRPSVESLSIEELRRAYEMRNRRLNLAFLACYAEFFLQEEDDGVFAYLVFQIRNDEKVMLDAARKYFDLNSQHIPAADETDSYTVFHRELYEIYKKAYTDGLTGVLNASAFRERVSHSLREDTSYSAILFIDLDYFKQINDTYGHAAGDGVLLAVVDILKSIVRSSDYLGRIGGDEFAIYLRKIHSASDAVHIGERICRKVSSMTESMGDAYAVSTSIGIAIAPEDSCNYDELMRIADQRLYLVKKSGRNGVFYRSA